MLNGEGMPRWSKLEAVVRQLAAWHVPGRDPDSEAARFLAMWEAAHPAGAHTSSITENGSQGVQASSLANTQNNELGDQIEPHVAEPLHEMSSSQTAFDHDLFLLHASPEIDVAQRIKMELESAGYRVWWDDGQLINSGAVGELTNTIRACRYLVVLLSAAFAKSPYSHECLTREVVSAIENAGVSIVPALYEMSPIPPELEPREFADFRTSPNTSFTRCAVV